MSGYRFVNFARSKGWQEIYLAAIRKRSSSGLEVAESARLAETYGMRVVGKLTASEHNALLAKLSRNGR